MTDFFFGGGVANYNHNMGEIRWGENIFSKTLYSFDLCRNNKEG